MQNLQKPKVIIFDWDNTLAENRDVVVGAMNKTLSNYGKEDWDTTKKKYRNPNKSLKENFFNFFGDKEKEAYKFYLDTYVDLLGKGVLKALPYSQALLKKLNSNTDIKLIIVSNKERSLLLMEIKALFNNISFYKIMANGDSEKNKPDASPVFKALENLGLDINPTNIWIIGDSSQDIDCAYNAGCQPILFGEGILKEKEYFDEKRKANPSMVSIKDFTEVSEYFGF